MEGKFPARVRVDNVVNPKKVFGKPLRSFGIGSEANIISNRPSMIFERRVLKWNGTNSATFQNSLFG